MANSNKLGSTHWMEDMQFQAQTKIPFPYPVAWSHDLIHLQLMSPKCILLRPKEAGQEAGDVTGEKRGFVAKSLWVGTSAKLIM